MSNVTDLALLDFTRFLKRSDRIVIGQACGEPTSLVQALFEQAPAIGDLSAFIGSSFSGLFTPEAIGDLSIRSMGAIGRFRPLTRAGKLGIIPCHVGQIGAMISSGMIGCDAALIQVSPADANGNHSLGLISDHVQAMIAKARVVIAEVNDQVPFTFGEFLPSTKIHCAVHVSRPPVEVAPALIGAADQDIARHAAAYIPDSAVIQTGVGSVPDAILRQLRDHKNLGLHSGMLGNAIVELVETGVVTNAYKEIDRDVSITGALLGTSRLYRWADRNPAIRMCTGNYTHDEAILGKLSRLVTINTALQVDLTGQVNAEQSETDYLGGTGGQLDFVRAGARSSGGRSIIALPATAKAGSISRIVPSLAGPVTTARSEVDVIVTEFGAAELKGQTLAERTRRLVAIAHPDFQSDLDRAAYEICGRGF